MSFDLTSLVGFYFNGLEVSTVDIVNAAAQNGDASLDYVPGSTIYNVQGNFNSNNSDTGFSNSNTIEQVTAASNGTAIDGTPLNNPLAVGQIVYNDVVNGAPSLSVTYDVLGYSADGSSLLVGVASVYSINNIYEQNDPYQGQYNIISDTNIDGNATPSLFPSGLQTFSPNNTYIGGPVTSGGVAADLVTVTSSLAGLSVPANVIVAASGTGVTQNADGTYTLSHTGAVLADGAGAFTALSSVGTGIEGQATLKFTGASGTAYFQVVGFNATQILLQAVSSAGVALKTSQFYVLSVSNAPAANASVDANFTNFGTAPNAATTYPCFLRGTRIRTPRGDVAVEDLQVGDSVVTLSGEAKRIIWLGRARVYPRFHIDPSLVHPVRISADAFGPGMPTRELFLSPDHAVFTDEMLIPVKELINGATVCQVVRSVVEYFHVELEQHDVVLAEGLPSETYLESGNRSVLEGVPVVAGGLDRTDFAYMVWESLGYRPLTLSGPGLEAVRAKLQMRAVALRHPKAA
jgi:hypothetical protein